MWAAEIILLTDAQRNILNRMADGTHTPLLFKARPKPSPWPATRREVA
ncbi:MAG: hypothetical protein LBU32_11635 [Clostridiales bacterium]|nr:hypothetical protein [Clostridiales bacterium]